MSHMTYNQRSRPRQPRGPRQPNIVSSSAVISGQSTYRTPNPQSTYASYSQRLYSHASQPVSNPGPSVPSSEYNSAKTTELSTSNPVPEPPIEDTKQIEPDTTEPPTDITEDNTVDNSEVVNDEEANAEAMFDDPTPKKKPFSSTNNSHWKTCYGTRYEVKCDETFAYYEGYVYDYDEAEKQLKVAYPWKDDQTVPVGYVRPVAPRLDAHWKPKQGEHAECQAKAEESEPYGWWDCIIKTVRDNLYLITYEGWDNHQEVLQQNMLRPYNNQPSFDEEGVVRRLMSISPERVAEFKSQMDLSSENVSNNCLSQIKRIAKQCQLIHCNFDVPSSKLLLIGKRQKVSDACMLIRFVWELRQIYRKKEESAKTDERLRQREYNELKNCVRIRFEFDTSLARFVIGIKGDNIAKAKDIKGVKHINVQSCSDTMSECLILATDTASAENARNILEMQMDYELIPAKVKRELIGEGGESIRRLENRSQVNKICTLDHLRYIRERNYQQNRGSGTGLYDPSFLEQLEYEERQNPDVVKLIIIGPKLQVPFAKMLIKSEVANIEQKQKFIERQNIAKQEINMDENYEYNNYEEEYNGYKNGNMSQRRRRNREQNYEEEPQEETSWLEHDQADVEEEEEEQEFRNNATNGNREYSKRRQRQYEKPRWQKKTT